jgi:hypothetical protein
MSDANTILRVYLDPDENGGFQPIGCEDRLSRAYGRDADAKKKEVERYLSFPHAPDWKRHELIEEGEIYASLLRTHFPELHEVIVKALANRFMYNWR